MPVFEEIKEGSELYLTEGVTDCLAMLSSGKAAVAIPSATIIPDEDLYLLKGYKLVMMPDNDEAGWEGYMKLCLSLIKKGIILLKEDIPVEYKDYGEWFAASIKNYCCPIKILRRHKKLGSIPFAGFDPFSLVCVRQNIKLKLCAKIVILADSRSMVR